MIAALVAFVGLVLALVVVANVTGCCRRPKGRAEPRSLLVVLGSGGHTAEMMKLLPAIDSGRFHPRHFVAAATDITSESRAKARKEIPENAVVWRVPRSREVGQSYAAALIPTARAILASVWLVSRLQPDVILCNGPGTCLPICLAAAVLRGVGWLRTRIVFVESVCRVNDLSATGKLLYYVADQVQVQWPELLRRYPKARYVGLLT